MKNNISKDLEPLAVEMDSLIPLEKTHAREILKQSWLPTRSLGR